MNHKQNIIEQGYTIFPGVFKESDLHDVREFTDSIIAFHSNNQDITDPFSNYFLPHRVDQGVLYDLFQRYPIFQNLAKDNRLIEFLKYIVGPNFFLYENSLVYKPKYKDNEVPWHQDFINRPDEPIKYVVWMALDDITIENGAMKVIPGSHKLGFLPWKHYPGETHHTRLDLSKVNLDDFKYAEMKAGDVLIFNQLLLHSSDRITSNLPRRAYRISVQSFEQIFSPRATPIVLSCDSPDAILNSTLKEKPKDNQSNISESMLIKAARKVDSLFRKI